MSVVRIFEKFLLLDLSVKATVETNSHTIKKMIQRIILLITFSSVLGDLVNLTEKLKAVEVQICSEDSSELICNGVLVKSIILTGEYFKI